MGRGGEEGSHSLARLAADFSWEEAERCSGRSDKAGPGSSEPVPATNKTRSEVRGATPRVFVGGNGGILFGV